MSHAPQIRMLRALCCAVDEILEQHEYGEFLEAGAKMGRDIACRAAEKLEDLDRALAQRLLDSDSDVRFHPKGKASK